MSDVFGPSIERELGSSERLLWKGRPRTGLRLRGSDALLIPFSLVWAGFACFAAFAAFLSPKANPGALFTVPFALIGLYIVIGRFFVDAKIRQNTEYAVTNRRAIIVSGLFGRKTRSINLQSTPEIALTEKADRSGTITFGTPAPYGWGMQGNLWFPGFSPQAAFDMIENARSVYEMIENAKRG
jgi:Bacterial PH domain